MPNCSRKTITEVAQPPQLQLHPIPAAFAAGIVSAAANAGPGQVFVPQHAEIHFCNHDRPGIGCARGVAQAAIFSAICDRDAVVANEIPEAQSLPVFLRMAFWNEVAPPEISCAVLRKSACATRKRRRCRKIFSGAHVR
jgi:hypothetical protein